SSALFVYRIYIPSSLYDIQQEKSTVHLIFIAKNLSRMQKSRKASYDTLRDFISTILSLTAQQSL
ncbi:MAG: hypothetical protein J6J05_07360, partial [Peptococcaceae bacterium]|nr:hypothetical protein [Peptococcaceae bacterium]